MSRRLNAVAPVCAEPLALWRSPDGRRAFVVTRRLPGPSLADVLAKDVGEEEAIDVLEDMIRIADALIKSGIVWRDIIPDNFMRDSDGHLKLIDAQFAIDRNDFREDPFLLKNWSYRMLTFAHHPMTAGYGWNDAAMMLFYLCSEYAINGWLVTYIQSKESLRAALSGEGAIKAYSQTMATLLWVVILAGRLFCAWLSQRVHPRRLMLIASIGEAAAFAGVLFSSSISGVTVCVALTGFCMAGICPMIYADAAYYTNTYPLATGTLLVFGAAGGILMPALVGFLAQGGGFEGSMAAILVSIILLVALSAVNTRMKTRKGESQP
jgi:hypothetical protein